MGNCKNCKHWEKYPASFWDFNRPMTACDLEVYDGEAQFEIQASAADDTNLSACLVTGPEFGCVHFHLIQRINTNEHTHKTEKSPEPR